MNEKKLNLQNTVNLLMGPEWQKIKNVKTSYSLFTPFKNKKTEQVFYFYIFYAPAQFHLSEETVNYALKKYQPYLSQVDFLLIERGFQFNCYLIKSDNYLIDLNQMIRLKKQCCEAIQKELIVKTIQFLLKFYKIKNINQFPQISPQSIGVAESGQLILCDYSLYFKKKCQLKTLSQNLCNCLMPMLESVSPKSSLNASYIVYNLQERLLSNYNQNFTKLVKTLILDPINKMENQGYFNGFSKELTLEQIQNSLQKYKQSQINDGNTTLNNTFQEQINQNENRVKRSQSNNIYSSYLLNQSIKEPFLPKSPVKNKKKHRIIIFVTFLALVFLIGIFSFVFLHYFKNPLVCQAGQFKKENANICLPCAQGCLRCSSDQNQSCYNCVQTMYLVLNDQNDKTGDCMKNCVGKVLHSNFCVKNKKEDNNKKKKSLNLSF